jgi:hypothetical protein
VVIWWGDSARFALWRSGSQLSSVAYREVVGLIEQQSTPLLRAELAAALADLQVLLMRELAARLRTAATPDAHWLPVEASADQLEASVRQIRWALRQRGTGRRLPA